MQKDNFEEESYSKKTPITFSREDKIQLLKKRRKRRFTRKKLVLTVLALMMVLFGFFGFKIWSVLNKIFEGTGLSAPGLLGELSTSELKGESSGRVNILLLGMGGDSHEGALLTDTIMVASIDPKKNDVALLSIPRDLYVNIPGNGYRRINEANSIGETEKYSGGGPALAKETVSRALDIPIHYYVRIDFEGFRKVIDTVGGVDVYVEEDIYDPYYPVENKGDTSVYSIDKGMHHMDGKAALKYVRSRKTTSDFDRAKRQQKVMVEVKNKVLSKETIFNPLKVTNILNALGNHVKTDFGLKDMRRLYEIGRKVDSGKVVTKVLDNNETNLLVSANEGGAYVLKPASGDWDEIRDFIKNIFADSYIKDENAAILISDASGIYGLGEKLAKKLKGYSYYVKKTEKANSASSKTKLYDYTGGKKPYAIKYLSQILDTSAETKSVSEEGIDIKIILGSDYEEE